MRFLDEFGNVVDVDLGQVKIKDKEASTMQVTYKGFTGELVKLEKKGFALVNAFGLITYDLSIYDVEKKVTHSFTDVNLEDVKFIGVEVSFK